MKRKTLRPEQEGTISPRQFLALCFVALFSPVIRQMPYGCVRAAGGTAWLAGAAACLPLCAGVLLLVWLLHRRFPREGLGEMILRGLGRPLGSAALLLLLGCILIQAGYSLRSSAVRLITTVYPESRPVAFLLLLGLGVLPAAMGRLQPLARMAKVFFPLVLLVVTLLFLLILPKCDWGNLKLPCPGDLKAIGASALPVMSVAGEAVYLLPLLDRTDRGGGRTGLAVAGCCAGYLALVTLVVVSVLGSFGAELSQLLNNAFFVMVRNISLLETVERVDAVVVGLWVVTDFILTGALLCSAAKLTCLLLGKLDRRLAGAVCTLAAMVISFVIAKDPFSFYVVAYEKIYWVIFAGAFVLVPLCCLIGRLRKRT